jgi:hypothetical protein
MADDITKVAEKVKAFRKDYSPEQAAILTSFTEDVVGDTPRVIGHCRIVLAHSERPEGWLMAEAFGTRALRAPKPGTTGMNDTRDPDRAMTQATGRALGLLGYGDGESLEGDTDEPDESGVQHAAQATPYYVELGWESEERMKEAHDLYVGAIKAEPEGIRSAMREYRKTKGYGWPMSVMEMDDAARYFATLPSTTPTEDLVAAFPGAELLGEEK